MNEISKKLSLEDDEKNKKELKAQLRASGYVLGILEKDPNCWLGVNKVSKGIDAKLIEDLLSKRNAARKNKNFEEADKIRKTLQDMGVDIEDTPTGTTWRNIKK